MEHDLNSRVDITAGFSITAIPELEDSIAKALEGVTVQKALNYGEVEVIVSNSGLDRHGESITMEGIDLKQIKRNPVVLWAHEYTSLPIGKITKLWKKDGNLYARIALATEEYDFASTVYKLILAGVISAVSIGGIVKEFGTKDGKTDYYTIAKLEMIELSVVPVGAHPDALVQSKSIESKEKFTQDYETFLHKSLVDKFKSLPDDTVSQLIKSLKETLAALESLNDSAVSAKAQSVEVVKRKLVVARQAAKQTDKGAELVIAAINEQLKSYL